MNLLPDLAFDVELPRIRTDLAFVTKSTCTTGAAIDTLLTAGDASRWRGEGGFQFIRAAPASYGCPHFTVAFFFLAIFAPFAWQCSHPLQLRFLSCAIFVAHPVQAL